MFTRRGFLLSAGAGGLAAAVPSSWQAAHAQVNHATTRFFVGFPPGGPVDIVARLLAKEMMGYAPTIIVENRPGAAGRLALETLRTSPPDGSVFLITPASMIVLYPHVYKKLGYDPQRDFRPITTVCSFPNVIAIGPKVPAGVRTLADFVAWCKTNPAQAAYGSPSAGAAPHFLGVTFARAAGIELQHIPYQGTSPAMQDLLSGEIAANVTVLPAVIPQISSGKVRALATTGSSRSPLLPDVPTFAESGYPGLVSVEWFGVFVPARTPDDIVDKLNHSVREALKSEAVKDGLKKLSFEVAGSTPAELAATIKATAERWGPIVQASGFKPED